MWQLIFIIIFTGLSFLSILLLRSFEAMSIRELKRQARSGNLAAAKVYSVRGAYDTDLWIFLWLAIGLMTSATVVLLDSLIWLWLALLISALLLLVSRVILPRLKRPGQSLKLAAAASPALGFILRYLHPVLRYPSKLVEKFTVGDPFVSVHSKEELLEILRHTPDDISLSKEEMRIATSALTFSDKEIGTIMIPLSSVHSISADTVLSPVELGDLHDSGFSRFPVYTEKNNFVGTLFLKDIIELRTNKLVKDVMRKGAYFVAEHGSLEDALKAFLKTHHHMFLVVNEFEEVIGLITIEDVIEQIIGAKIVDEFDQYDDLRAVAAERAKKIHLSRDEQTVVE